MADIIKFGGQTKLPVPIDGVLRDALEEHENKGFKAVIVLAIYDNDKPYYAASEADACFNNWLADTFKFQLQVINDAG
jgi:hypothetical protein